MQITKQMFVTALNNLNAGTNTQYSTNVVKSFLQQQNKSNLAAYVAKIDNLAECVDISSYTHNYYRNNFDSFDHMVNYFNAHYFVYHVDYNAQTIYHADIEHTALTHTAKMVTNAVSNIVNNNATEVDNGIITLFINEVGYNNSSNHLIAHIVNAAKVTNVTVEQATVTTYYALGGTNL